LIWASIPLMTILDVIVVGIGAFAGWSFLSERLPPDHQARTRGGVPFFLGIGLITAFFAADLFVMHGLPLVAPNIDATAVMNFLHLEFSWFAFIAGLTSIVTGFTLNSRDLAALLRRQSDFNVDRDRMRTMLRESEERFRPLVETTKAIAWEMNIETWCFTYVSPQAVPLIGYPVEDWKKENFWIDHLEPEDKDSAVEYCTASTERGEDHEFEYRMIAADGRAVWLRDIVTVVMDNGQPVQLRGFMVDITEQKEAERALRVSDQRFRAIFDNVPAALFMKEVDGAYKLINRKYTDWFGIEAEEIVGKTVHELYPKERADHYAAGDRKTARLATVVSEEVDIPLPKGETRAFTLTKFPISDGDHMTAIGGVMVDISERKQVESQLELLIESAEEANRAKSLFLANMSHEIRTPLNAILGFADTMRSELFGPLGSERYLDYTDGIYVSGRHLLELINDILDISRIEAGEYPIRKEQVPVTEIIDECMTIVQNMADASTVSLRTHVVGASPHFLADRRALKQIALNLMSNAVKFSQDGGEIVVSYRCDNGWSELSVVDEGKGIAKEDIPTITNPFERGRIGAYEDMDGIGLGLAITKSLIELHDGTLGITSKLGEGTTVTVGLPQRSTDSLQETG
jgi:PAS domain S-box-containing protein